MITINANVVGHQLTAARTQTLASGSVGVDVVHFEFDSAWDGMDKVALFWQKGSSRPYGVRVDGDGNASIPWEVIDERRRIKFGVYGTEPGETVPRITSTVLLAQVPEGAWSESMANSGNPTPTMIEQFEAAANAAIAAAQAVVGTLEDDVGTLERRFDSFTAPVEAATTASADHAVGSMLTLDGTLYTVVAAIAAGETIAPGVNVMATSVIEQLEALVSAVGAKADPEPHNGLYDGRDLSAVFPSAAAFHAAVGAGDFSKIRVGDYWPVRLSGAFYDYGLYTVPAGTEYFTDAALTTSGGTAPGAVEGQYESATAVKFKAAGADVYCAIGDCLPYFERTLDDAVVLLEVAGINNYMGYGEAGEQAAEKPHLTFVSRDCLPVRLRMSKGKGVWEDTDNRTPWLGSALYKTLNDSDHGIVKLLGETDIGAYVHAGPNGSGMRANMEVKAAGAGAATGWRWGDRGKLFLPFEAEVFGQGIWSGGAGCSFGCSLQRQIFAGSMRHIAKGVGNGSRHTTWWMASTDCELVDCFCIANNQTLPNSDYGTNAYGVPICFVMT